MEEYEYMNARALEGDYETSPANKPSPVYYSKKYCKTIFYNQWSKSFLCCYEYIALIHRPMLTKFKI